MNGKTDYSINNEIKYLKISVLVRLNLMKINQ